MPHRPRATGIAKGVRARYGRLVPASDDEDFAALLAESERTARRDRRIAVGDVVRGRVIAVGGDVWTLADLDPLEPRHLHVQQVCRARMDGREGIGVLEQLVIGPHTPSGFHSLIDGAR